MRWWIAFLILAALGVIGFLVKEVLLIEGEDIL